jgi:GDP-L-fucose synthase
MMNSNSILVTGSGGFVGNNLIEVLRTKGYKIYAPSSSELNLVDLNSLESFVESHKPSFIVHLAYNVPRRINSMDLDFIDFISNMTMFSNLISVGNSHSLIRVIFISSTIIENFPIPSNEKINLLLLPKFNESKFFYKLSKTLEFNYLISNSDLKFKFTNILVSNIFGPYDKFDGANSHLVAKIIEQIINAKENNNSSITILGTGNELVHLSYVGDLVNLIVRELDVDDGKDNIYKIEPSNIMKVKDLAKLIALEIGYTGAVLFSNNKIKKSSEIKVHRVKKVEHNIELKNALQKTISYFISTRAGNSNGKK